MEDLLLIDAAERYHRGEMSEQERTYFEEIRKNNPEVDQQVVEYLFFLQEMEQFARNRSFRHELSEVATSLTREGFISREPLKGKAKLVHIWNRSRKTIAVAASIAGIVSLLSASLFSVLTHKKEATAIKPLVDKIREQDYKTRTLENKIRRMEKMTVQSSPEKPRLEATFRATGFLIDAQHQYIVTNTHVIREAQNQLIVENNKGEQYIAKTVYINNQNDLAILQITDPDFKKMPALPYSIKKSAADLGESIYLLGYPKQEIVYGEGYVSARNGYEMDSVFFQLSTAANEGNSGSPVFNKQGEVVGIISSMETSAVGVVFAIKSNHIYEAIDQVNRLKGKDPIQVNTKQSLKGLNRTGQIRKVQDYIFMVKGN